MPPTGPRLRTTADYTVDRGGATYLLACNHCGMRMVGTDGGIIRDHMRSHLAAAHPAQCKRWNA